MIHGTAADIDGISLMLYEAFFFCGWSLVNTRQYFCFVSDADDKGYDANIYTTYNEEVFFFIFFILATIHFFFFFVENRDKVFLVFLLLLV